MYLCGTKVDLVEENKKARKVDLHNVREYAEGQWVLFCGSSADNVVCVSQRSMQSIWRHQLRLATTLVRQL